MAHSLDDLLAGSVGRWLVTGAAGFIGSHLVAALLKADREVVGLDNFATGNRKNLALVSAEVSAEQWQRFHFIEGDIANATEAAKACEEVSYVLHQAALGSVPRSVADPQSTNRSNIDGFLTMLCAARDARVRRFVYASSSSIYGDNPDLPKREDRVGKVLSPYALTKAVDEEYARLFHALYKMPVIGLRYFNVFGPRQDPNGAYAAVIPRWLLALKNKNPCVLHGDGNTSRDFCYVDNVVQANIRAALGVNSDALGQAFNIACGETLSLKDLYSALAGEALKQGIPTPDAPQYTDFRAGDIQHSLADISKAKRLLDYSPTVSAKEGLQKVATYFFTHA